MKVVFILSSRRSGSTWLNLVLGSCSWAMNLGEYDRPWTNAAPVVCRLCQARGLAQCTVLHGYETVDRQDAFRFAASRSGKSVLVDCSKSLSWCESFLGQDGLETRLIHLLRHPCGYIESERRRAPDRSIDDLLTEWEAQNRAISDFLERVDSPGKTISYDELADAPAEHFPGLCDFIGGPWEQGALEYWKAPHHGLGGNGAASVYLKGYDLQPFETGDDRFYEAVPRRPTSADVRFRERLPLHVRTDILARPYVQTWNERLGSIWRP